MTNEKYTGEFKFGGRDCKNIYPAIVDKALFAKVQEKLSENKYVLGGQETAKVPYLLSGKVFCGHCGAEMVADKSTGHSGKKYSYYTCKNKQKHKCEKLRENKDNLEAYVTSCVVNFLRDKKNAQIAVNTVFAYYEKRTEENGIKSINAKIANVQAEAEKLTDAFINAKTQLLRNKIEAKMAEYEILLDNLEMQKVQLELERGYRISKKDLLDFIEELLKGDVNDKDYQKQIIDHLVSQVFVSDDNTVVYFNIRGGKNIDRITIADTTEAIENNIKNVRPLTSPLHQIEIIRTFCGVIVTRELFGFIYINFYGGAFCYASLKVRLNLGYSHGVTGFFVLSCRLDVWKGIKKFPVEKATGKRYDERFTSWRCRKLPKKALP